MRHPQGNTARAFAQKTWLGGLVIVAAACAAYANSFGGPFVFDDPSSIVANPTIRHLGSLWTVLKTPHANVSAAWRPLLNLSLAINYAIGGTNVWGYHLLNLLIHACAGLALFGIIRRTLEGRGWKDSFALALSLAVLWTVHPLQSEAVTYVIQRAESMMGLFYLLTLYCFIRAAAASGKARVWEALSFVCCLCGMATKEAMISAPLIVLLYDRTFVAGNFLDALRRRGVYYASLASTWVLLATLIILGGGNRSGSIGFGVDASWWGYELTQFKALLVYLRLSLFPYPLVFEYGTFWVRGIWDILPGAIVVLPLGILSVIALWRWPVWGFLGFWFFSILAPTSLVAGTSQMIVEHRMYLPLAAVLVAAICGVHSIFPKSARFLPGLLGVVAIVFAGLTLARNEDYKSIVTLWNDTLAKRPRNPLAHTMLAEEYATEGRTMDALKEFEKSLALDPLFPLAHENIGEALYKLGRHDEAIAHYKEAIRLKPDFADAYDNLGVAMAQRGDKAGAVVLIRKAIEHYPDYPEAHYNLGDVLSEMGRGAEAAVEYEAAIRCKSDYPAAHYNLANTFIDLGRGPEAVDQYEEAIREKPDYPEAEYNLANALAMQHRQSEAAAHYARAVDLRPNYPEAQSNWGSALFELGQLDQAQLHYEAALRLDPQFSEARDNLARLEAIRKAH